MSIIVTKGTYILFQRHANYIHLIIILRNKSGKLGVQGINYVDKFVKTFIGAVYIYLGHLGPLLNRA
jgi:hypothetical protein